MSDPIVVTVVSPFPPLPPVDVTVIQPDKSPITDSNRGFNGITNTDGNLGFRLFVGATNPTVAGYTPIIGDVWIT